MGIPDLGQNGELPPGEHTATLDEVEQHFGLSTPRRIALMKGLRAAVANLAKAKVGQIWINGSFITDKPEPNDIDGCWQYSPDVNLERLDPVFLMPSRLPMKAKFGVEFFPASVVEAASGVPFPRFFQINRDGEPKGIIVVQIGGVQ